MEQFGNLRHNLIAIIFGFMMVIPMWVYSAGLVPCGGPAEEPCQTCHVVQLISNTTNWLITILGILVVLIIVFAGARLVTSAGNASAMEAAKKLMTNMLIGYVIVLAGWLLIDYGFKVLFNEGDFGPWNVVECVVQPEIMEARIKFIDLGLANRFGPISVTDADGNITTINPDGAVTSAGGSCGVINNTSNSCHPSNLSCFGNRASQASQICNIESGGNPRAISGTDRCKDGRSFSAGLWQINILAHGQALGCDTSNFRTYGSGTQGSCLRRATNSAGVEYCAAWNCEFTDANAYNQCMSRLFEPSTNTNFACGLFSRSGFTPWRISARRCRIPE